MRRRAAFTLVEVTVAIVVLAMAAVAVGQFASQVRQGLRDRALSGQLGWELENVRERVRSWNVEDVTADRIAEIPISPALAARVDRARWVAEVQTLESPIAVKQVALALECHLYGQRSTPAKLTFWLDLGADDAE